MDPPRTCKYQSVDSAWVGGCGWIKISPRDTWKPICCTYAYKYTIHFKQDRLTCNWRVLRSLCSQKLVYQKLGYRKTSLPKTRLSPLREKLVYQKLVITRRRRGKGLCFMLFLVGPHKNHKWKTAIYKQDYRFATDAACSPSSSLLRHKPLALCEQVIR